MIKTSSYRILLSVENYIDIFLQTSYGTELKWFIEVAKETI